MTPLLLATALAASLVLPAAAHDPVRNVVLLHGATMNAAAWRPVHDILRRRGFAVTMVDLPLTSLADDVAAAQMAIERQGGPTVLVGHSYGGAVASVAGADPRVRALVYVAAFQPDAGESVGALNARRPVPAHPLDLGNGTMVVDPAHYAADVAADLAPEDAAFLAASQRPTGFAAFTDTLPAAAWRDKPSVGILASRDRTIHPDLQRFMYERAGAEIVEVEASHVPHLSRPDVVADAISSAAKSARDDAPAADPAPTRLPGRSG